MKFWKILLIILMLLVNLLKHLKEGQNWAYMTPNLMLYSCVGFLSGIRNKKNSDLLDELSEDLFETTVDFIGETTDILEDISIKEKVQKKILTNINKINEHNN